MNAKRVLKPFRPTDAEVDPWNASLSSTVVRKFLSDFKRAGRFEALMKEADCFAFGSGGSVKHDAALRTRDLSLMEEYDGKKVGDWLHPTPLSSTSSVNMWFRGRMVIPFSTV